MDGDLRDAIRREVEEHRRKLDVCARNERTGALAKFRDAVFGEAVKQMHATRRDPIFSAFDVDYLKKLRISAD